MRLRQHWLIPETAFTRYRDYLDAMGGSPVEKARTLAPNALIQEVTRSGLRGRGGAGFPTGVKWAAVRGHSCTVRDVVCNATEGEPGTFKDRHLIRWNPYAILEGVLICAHAVGARAAYVAVKASFVREAAALRRALDEMAGVIAGLPVHVVEGPEEYLLGEEKALLNVIEGEGPLPRLPEYPPYEVGLFATPGSPNPAVCNNAETLAHVPSIVLHGAESFRTIGTIDTPGTILVTLSGDLQRPGVYETEAGAPLRRLFEEQGGGPRPGRRFRAALPGVSGAPILPDKLDTPAEFGALHLAGSSLGSAGFVLIDDTRSIPRVAQTVARFLYVESCNQCSACKEGLRTASRALDEIFDPDRATEDDPERALYGASRAPQGNRCYLPVQGSIIIPALLRCFRSDFEAQVRDPTAASEPWPIPKLVDFDEKARVFRLDPNQQWKQPNWTYAAPPSRPSAATPPPDPRTTAVPAARADGQVAVRIAPDLRERLAALAGEAQVDLDRQVDGMLRDWLRSRDARG